MKTFQFFSNRGEVFLSMAIMFVVAGLLYQGMNTLWEGKARGFNKNTKIKRI